MERDNNIDNLYDTCFILGGNTMIQIENRLDERSNIYLYIGFLLGGFVGVLLLLTSLQQYIEPLIEETGIREIIDTILGTYSIIFIAIIIAVFTITVGLICRLTHDEDKEIIINCGKEINGNAIKPRKW